MAEYIDCDDVIRAINWQSATTMTRAAITYAIKSIPAADVAPPPVVHSYWEEYSCSQCMGTDECGEPKWRDGRFYVCHNYKCRRKTVIATIAPTAARRWTVRNEDIQKSVGDAGKLLRENWHCKDCKYNIGTKKCLNPDSFFAVPKDDDFCSYGERKDGDNAI